MSEARAALDGVAASGVFLSQVLLTADAARAAEASLTADTVAQWPGERTRDIVAGLAWLERAASHPVGQALVADFTRLFVGPGPMLACPWESVHRGEEGLVFGVHTIQVRQAYAEHGLAAPRLGHEPDDHIGLECGFIAQLALGALDALEAGATQAARRFLSSGTRFIDEHLAQWAPELADIIIREAATDFYRAVGHLLRGSIPQWRETLATATE